MFSRIPPALLAVFLTFSLEQVKTNQAEPKPSHATRQALETQDQPKGAIEGRIFGITRGGDLKPARMAKVFLLFDYADPKQKPRKIVYSAASKFRMSYMNVRPIQPSASGTCEGDWRAADEAILLTLRWATERQPGSGLPFPRAKEVYSAQADEEGYFHIGSVRPGTYKLIARGRAGENDAYWEQDLEISPGKTVSVKLAEPREACFGPE